jgi:hypothetical protein
MKKMHGESTRKEEGRRVYKEGRGEKSLQGPLKQRGGIHGRQTTVEFKYQVSSMWFKYGDKSFYVRQIIIQEGRKRGEESTRSSRHARGL